MRTAESPDESRQLAEAQCHCESEMGRERRDDQQKNGTGRRVACSICDSQGEALDKKRLELPVDSKKRISRQMGDKWIEPGYAVRQTEGWWAVYTRHQHEKSVADQLERKGLEVFLPLYESDRRWKDRTKTLTLPLFPSYVFVRGDSERRLQIVSTPGAHMIVSNGSRFSEIPEEEIDAIRRALQSKHAVEPHPLLHAGDRVRVIRGALEGLEGILVRKRNSYRLILTVAMLAQSAAVEVSALDVEPILPTERDLALSPSVHGSISRRGLSRTSKEGRILKAFALSTQ